MSKLVDALARSQSLPLTSRERTKRANFGFPVPPLLAVGLNYLDVDNEPSVRLFAVAEETMERTVKVNLSQWGDTKASPDVSGRPLPPTIQISRSTNSLRPITILCGIPSRTRFEILHSSSHKNLYHRGMLFNKIARPPQRQTPLAH